MSVIIYAFGGFFAIITGGFGVMALVVGTFAPERMVQGSDVERANVLWIGAKFVIAGMLIAAGTRWLAT